MESMFSIRFDENFTNGTNPDDWVSSLDIVQQWYDGGKKPVNYGQCWVFGCLGRTLTASLGLVSRQVSRRTERPLAALPFLTGGAFLPGVWRAVEQHSVGGPPGLGLRLRSGLGLRNPNLSLP